MGYAERVKAVQRILLKKEQESLLVSSLVNIRYLTGFSGSSALLVLNQDALFLLTDFRYVSQVQEECTGVELVQTEGNAYQFLSSFLSEQRIRHLLVEQEHLSWGNYRLLSKGGEPAIELTPSQGLIESLRAKKEPEEIAAIERSVILNSQVFDSFLAEVQPGRTEQELAAKLEQALRQAGATKLAFDILFSSGPRAALPHGVAGMRRLSAQEFVLIDVGVVYNGYCSDMTRTIYIGKPSDEERRLYEIVLEAQQAVISGLHGGISGREADRLAREVICEAGYGEYFGHGTGHGIGLEVHEAPRLAPQSEDRLDAGSVVTVEPGIYLPGQGGVRIEDVVVVEEGKARVLTTTPKAFIMI